MPNIRRATIPNHHLFLAVAAILFASSAAANNTLTVYYLPFQIETYDATTTNNITCRATEQWTISDQGDIDRFNHLFGKIVTASIDETRVRLKAINGQMSVYVDADGHAVKDNHGYRDTHDYKLDKASLIEFLSSLRPSQRQHNRPSTSQWCN